MGKPDPKKIMKGIAADLRSNYLKLVKDDAKKEILDQGIDMMEFSGYRMVTEYTLPLYRELDIRVSRIERISVIMKWTLYIALGIIGVITGLMELLK